MKSQIQLNKHQISFKFSMDSTPGELTTSNWPCKLFGVKPTKLGSNFYLTCFVTAIRHDASFPLLRHTAITGPTVQGTYIHHQATKTQINTNVFKPHENILKSASKKHISMICKLAPVFVYWEV